MIWPVSYTPSMPTATIELAEVQPSEKEELWKNLQEYLREFPEFIEQDIPAGRDITYHYWDYYWDGSTDRHKYWIVIGEGKVGFVLLWDIPVNLWPTAPPPTQIAEFGVFPMFRNREIGSSVLKFLLTDFNGRGEILTWDCLVSNTRAEAMYDRVVAEFRRGAGPEWRCTKTQIETESGLNNRYICEPG